MKHARMSAIAVLVGLFGSVRGVQAQTPPTTFSGWTSDWSPTASLGQARAAGTATLLTSGPNAGKVLVAGGTSVNSTNTAEIYDPATGTGVWANSMAQARYFHTATTLSDGRILIAGGALNGASGGIAQAELYDPVAGTFTSAGTMVTGRFLHTATLLANGTVLVTGGQAGGTLLASAEIYAPPTTSNPSGNWTAVGSLGTARTAHTATLLPNGNVLVAGGQDSTFSATASTEQFSPASKTFSAGHAMLSARAYHTATARGGSVYLIGGFGPSGEVKQTDVFGGAWFSAGASLNDARDSHTATLLPNGDILVAGGEDAAQVGTTSVEVLGAATGTFSVKASMSSGRLYHMATLLPNGDVFVTGGLHYSPSFAVLTSSEIFDPLFATPTAALLASTLENHTATPVTGILQIPSVLVAGGDTGGAFVGTAATMFFSPSANALSAGPSMTTARFMHTATPLPGGAVLMVGGQNAALPIGTAEVFTPAQLGFNCPPPLGRRCFLTVIPAAFRATAGAPVTGRYQHTATYIPSINKVLIAGGLASTTGGGLGGTSAAELYDPATDSFAATGSMVFDRYAHTATLVSIGGHDKVLITGGWSNAQVNVNGGMGAITHTVEIFDPATGTFTMPALSSSSTSSTWLVVNRQSHVATPLASGQVLFTGGFTSGQTPTSAAEVFDPATGRFTRVGSMSVARIAHGAALTSLAGGKVLVAGGYIGFTGPATASVDLFDPTTGLFSATTEPLRQARAHHTVTPLSDGRILFFGGQGGLTTELSKIMN